MANTTADKLQGVINSKAALGQVISSHGGTVPQTFAGYPAALDGIVGGALDLGASIVENGITEIPQDVAARIVTVRPYAFYKCNTLRTLSLPNATSIGEAAFRDCSVLSSLYLPLVEFIDTDSFSAQGIAYDSTVLTSVSLPSLVSTGASRAFYRQSSLETVDLPECKTLGTYTFAMQSGRTILQTVNIPKAETIGLSSFSGCQQLRTVNITGKTCAEIKAMTDFPWGMGTAWNCHIVGSDGYVTPDGTIVPA